MKYIILSFLLIPLLSIGQEIPEKNIIVDLDFNDGEFKDVSFYKHTLINHGAEIVPTFDGSGMKLSGDDAFLEVEYFNTLKIEEELTTSFWYKHVNQDEIRYHPLIEQSANLYNGHARYGTWIFDRRKLITCIEPNICANQQLVCERCIPSIEVLVEDNWYHIATTYDGSTLSLYINGKLDNSTKYNSSTKISTAPVSLTVGSDVYDNPPNFLKGTLDEIKVMDIALSPEQIEEIYAEFGAVRTSDIQKLNLVLYPNPTSDFLIIDGLDKPQEISLYNVAGQLVMKAFVLDKLDVRDLEQGFYYLEVQGAVEKILIAR